MDEIMESNLVSVIIPTYNRAKLLSRAINSVLNQTYKNVEIIVVDDGSTDNTEEVLKSFNDEKIKYIRHEKNKGASAARNTGIKVARGEYIAFLDDDDEWLKDKLKKQVETIKNLPSDVWGGIYCGFFYVTDKKVMMVEATKKGDLKKAILNKEVDIGASSTLLFSIDAIKEIGLFDESFERHQDWEYLIRFFRKYKLFSLRDPLVKVYGPNMPNGKKAARVKEKYLSKFKKDIYEFGDETAREIIAKHWLEVAAAFAKEVKVRECIFYLKKSIIYRILPLKEYLNILILINKTLIKKIFFIINAFY